MIGKPGKNLSNTRGADAEPPLNHLWDEIEALPDSDARFGAIFENAAVGVACVAPDGRWVEVNQRLCDIVGYTREELLTKTFGDITHPDDLEQDLRAMRRMLAGEIETYLREKRYYHKDGSVVWANLTVSLMRKADGSPDYFISIVEDITERKQVEEKLRESQERLQIFIEHAPAALAMFDCEMRYLAVSRRWVADYHLGDGDIRGRSHYDVFPEISEQWKAVHRRALEGEAVRADEDCFVRADGSVQWLRWDVRPWYAANGAIGGIVIFTEDITEQKRAGEALRASEEKFRILADTAPVMIWMSGMDRLCTFFNKPWLDFTGRAMEEELGNGWTEGVHPEDYDRCLEIYVTSFEAREPFDMEYRLRRYNGEYRWLLDHGVPRFSPGGDFLGYIGSCIDITERREIEEALRASELRFRTMISAIPNLSYETDADGANIFTSDQWRAYTGMTVEESAGTGFIRAYHPDEAEDVLAQWKAAVRSGMSFERKCRIRAADGSYRWFLNRAQPGRDAEGRIVRWAGSLTDIDDLIRAEEKARENELRFRTMVSAIPSLTFESDVDGNNI